MAAEKKIDDRNRFSLRNCPVEREIFPPLEERLLSG
jgi:hypothetical protein